jgi:hypothetical protein
VHAVPGVPARADAGHPDEHPGHIGAIIFSVTGIVWGIVLLIESIPAIVKAVRVTGALVKSAK